MLNPTTQGFDLMKFIKHSQTFTLNKEPIKFSIILAHRL